MSTPLTKEQELRHALTLCVASLDQLLPYLAKVPADVGLVNDALTAARPLLKEAPVEPAQAQDEREAVPRWKFHALVEHCKKQDQLISDLYARLNSVRLYDAKEVWFWQGGGCDHLESLACPVVIEADELRRLVNAAPIAQTEQQPVLSNCLDLVEKMTVSVDVSTGDDDAFNRLFCKVAGVQEESDGSWTILAVDPEPNFAAPIAQTEQQPVATWMGTDWNAQQQLIAHLCTLEPGTDLYAAPIAQTEQQPERPSFGAWSP